MSSGEGTAGQAEFSREQVAKLGLFIRQQRQKARLSLRQLAELANVSNPYLSQIERGLHEPSVRVLKAIAAGLDLSADVLLAEAGLLERVTGRSKDGVETVVSVEMAIATDPRLTADQKSALIQVYRSYVGG
jgi:transcriptional regulator with XRE-family HTH domain